MAGRRDPGARDELRRHLRRGRAGGRRDPLQRDLLAGDPRPLRRRRPRDRLAPPSRADRRRGAARPWARPAPRSRRSTSSPSPRGPGLVGALLVGVATAKALAAAHELPLAAVDHLHGHVAASFLAPEPFEPPFLSLIASGGHTLLARVDGHGPGFEVLGQTLDDAAGEAFDKGARLLGLGYPGGAALERLARDGDPDRVRVPDRRRASRPRLLLRRAEDRAALPRARARATPRPSAAAPTSPPPTSTRSSRSLALRVERACGQTGSRASGRRWRRGGQRRRCVSAWPSSVCALDVPEPALCAPTTRR